MTDESLKQEYGIFIGRFQPFHKMHEMIINEIIKDNRCPIIIIASTGKDIDLVKNPLNFSQRLELIRTVFPQIPLHYFIPIKDYDDPEKWYNQFKSLIKEKKSRCTIYYHVKENDKCDYEFKSKSYKSELYHKIFEIENWNLKELETKDININATNIRNGLQSNKDSLNPLVYNKLIEWGIF